MNSPRLLIGCPVRDRGWILPKWYDHVLAAAENAGFQDDEIGFVFVGQPHNDLETFDVIHWFAARYPTTVLVSSEPTRNARSRNWSAARFHEMVGYRNALLGLVRDQEPDLFLSLDSDILLAPQAISSAFDAMSEYALDAVGLKCFMTDAHRSHPSYGMIAGGGLVRSDHDGVLCSVDVIMAAKLMGPAAYNTDYKLHRIGEDIGWSLAAKRTGVRLGWDGQLVNKHVMRRDQLNTVDDRCGF